MSRSKRSLLFLLTLTLIISTLGVIAAQEYMNPNVWPDLEGREVYIAVENAYPPYNYLNDDNEAVGWDYDTFDAICELLNCVPVYEETGWDGMLIAIAAVNLMSPQTASLIQKNAPKALISPVCIRHMMRLCWFVKVKIASALLQNSWKLLISAWPPRLEQPMKSQPKHSSAQ